MQTLVEKEFDTLSEGTIISFKPKSTCHLGFRVTLDENDDTYSLQHIESNSEIADGLALFSAAIAIAEQLTKENYTAVNTILYLEDRFNRHYQNAQFHKNASNWDMYDNENMDALACVNLIQSYCHLDR